LVTASDHLISDMLIPHVPSSRYVTKSKRRPIPLGRRLDVRGGTVICARDPLESLRHEPILNLCSFIPLVTVSPRAV